MGKVGAFKGFNFDWTCRDFQFEVGQSYSHEGSVRACSSGFHACTNPIDVFQYYPPGTSRFAEVTLSGEQSSDREDSKISAEKITITAEISLSDMIEKAVKAVFDAATLVKGSISKKDSGAASATGDIGAASATGYRGAASATGDRGAASATGYSGAASATGYSGAASATGDRGAAMASGRHGKAKGSNGCVIFLVERDQDWNITSHWSGLVGEGGIDADTYYTLVDGLPVKAEASQ